MHLLKIVKFPLNISGDDYWNILNEGPPNWEADAILFNSFIIALIPPSKKWGIWADRYYEVSVIAFNDYDVSINSILKSWLPAEYDKVLGWMGYSFRPYFKVPQSIAKELQKIRNQ